MAGAGNVPALASPRYIVIHHTAIASTVAREQLGMVDAAHCRRWGNPSPYTGYCVEYHYFIGLDGTVVHTRKEEKERTGHTRNTAYNMESVAVVFAGNFAMEEMNPKQLASGRRVITGLMERYGIPKGQVVGHREASATACPGENVMRLLTRE